MLVFKYVKKTHTQTVWETRGVGVGSINKQNNNTKSIDNSREPNMTHRLPPHVFFMCYNAMSNVCHAFLGVVFCVIMFVCLFFLRVFYDDVVCSYAMHVVFL